MFNGLTLVGSIFQRVGAPTAKSLIPVLTIGSKSKSEQMIR